MIEEQGILEMITNSVMFKLSLGTIITTLTGWALLSIRNTSKKIKNAPTKDDLAKAKAAAFKYTDERMKVHEDLQIMELTGLKDKITDTHKMVTMLHEIALNKQ